MKDVAVRNPRDKLSKTQGKESRREIVESNMLPKRCD